MRILIEDRDSLVEKRVTEPADPDEAVSPHDFGALLSEVIGAIDPPRHLLIFAEAIESHRVWDRCCPGVDTETDQAEAALCDAARHLIETWNTHDSRRDAK